MASPLTGRDLSSDPIVINDRWRVTADGLQWIVQRRRENSKRGWDSVIFCQTRGGLIVNLGYEAFGVGSVEPDAWSALKSLPEHRRHAPGYTGVDVEAEIARVRAQDARYAKMTDAAFFRLCAKHKAESSPEEDSVAEAA